MPKKVINDYYFYKIVCDDLPHYIYIGSTCDFIRRKSLHKSDCNNINRKNSAVKQP